LLTLAFFGIFPELSPADVEPGAILIKIPATMARDSAATDRRDKDINDSLRLCSSYESMKDISHILYLST
jgi:hypothetical protein